MSKKYVLIPFLFLISMLIASSCTNAKVRKLQKVKVTEETGTSKNKTDVAAIVEGKKIFYSEVNNEYNFYTIRLKAKKQPPPNITEKEKIISIILDELILFEVVQVVGKKEGIVVSPQEVANTIKQTKESMTTEKFAKYLKVMGWTEEVFANTVKVQLTEKKLIEKITKNLKTDKEKQQYFEKYIDDNKKKLSIKKFI